MNAKTPLIVTNGSSGVSAIQRAGIEGHIISWDDVLHEGPVPNLEPKELIGIRSEFLALNSEMASSEIEAQLLRRNDLVENRDANQALVLCFEHDLYDQLQIVQILDFCSSIGKTDGIHLVQSGDYLSEIDSKTLASLFDHQELLGERAVNAAKNFWSAFTESEPYSIGALSSTDLEVLPFLNDAKDRLCLLYPSEEDGMSFEERSVLNIVQDSKLMTLAELFTKYQESERAKFLGDLFFEVRLDWMIESSLLEFAEPRSQKEIDESSRSRWQREIILTETGKRILQGEELLFQNIGIRERWIGGVRVDKQSPWKWDKAESVFIR